MILTGLVKNKRKMRGIDFLVYCAVCIVEHNAHKIVEGIPVEVLFIL